MGFKDIYKNFKFENPIKKRDLVKRSAEIPLVIKLDLPAIQKVEEINPTPRVRLPEVQKVEVTNPQEVKMPEVQKVEVTNPTKSEPVKFPEVQKVEITNQDKVEFPKVQKVEVTNPSNDIPVGKGNTPGQADPEKYVPVRLTDGKKFYSGMQDAYVSAAKTVFPFVDVNGKPHQVQLDGSGNLPVSATVTPAADQQVHITPGVTTAVSGSLSLTTTSGSPMSSAIVNYPTVTTVSVQNLPYVQVQPGVTTAVSGSISLTTTSGSPMSTAVTNYPTVQTVSVQSLPLVTVSSMPTNTVVSGTVQTISGSKTDIQNFPTIQTVNVQTIPNITTASGSMMDIKNFPTFQTVNVQNIPSLTISTMPTNTVVSGTVLTISGSKTDIQNFPTIQTVRDNSVTISGSQHTLVDNFPTIQTTQLANGLGYSSNPVTISGVVGITDGKAIANILTSSGVANGQNAQLIAGSYQEIGNLSAGSLNADLVSSLDVSNWKSAGLHINGSYSGTLSVQGSNDNSNFQAVFFYDTATGSGGTTTTATNKLIMIPLSFRYLRVRMTAYSSGAATGTLELYSQSIFSNTVLSSQNGNWSTRTQDGAGNAITSNSSTFSGNRGMDVNILGSGGTAFTTPGIVTVSGVVDIIANTPTMVSGVGSGVLTVKGTSCILDSYYIYNPNSSVTYLQLFDAATATTVSLGSTVPKHSIGIPATSAANLAEVALQFLNGLKIAATTTAGGSTGPTTGIDCNFGYK